MNKEFKDNYKHKNEFASAERSIDMSKDKKYEELNKIIKNQEDEVKLYKSQIAE